jgi:hydrogenase maturation protein HypF
LGLAGHILNSPSGVTIEVEGVRSAIGNFVTALRQSAPSLAEIRTIQTEDLIVQHDEEFVIRESLTQENGFALVCPDVALCSDCLRELMDPKDRRHGYPFINCACCGPRYTITENVPYDRPRTTMAGFTMCSACEAEYENPSDRRFHAQPIACPACGPTVALIGDAPNGNRRGLASNHQDALSVFRAVRGALRSGEIIAIKGLGGFHLACDAENDTAVRSLRARKKRNDKPFAVMAYDLEAVQGFCEVSSADCELLVSWQRPIVLLSRLPGARISAAVAPGSGELGVMLPYTPIHHLLFRDSSDTPPEFIALVMTSGNISEEPIVASNEEAGRRLSHVAHQFLFHNRPIHMRVDDSVARTYGGRPRILRRSRGYAPQPIELGFRCAEVLACGAELKNTFCLTKQHYAVLSQHIGDLDNHETLQFFEESTYNLKRLFNANPVAVAYDLHPMYLSSRIALGTGLPAFPVQHHHAHIASCMAENNLRGLVIGIAFDGTGYGLDSCIWGGEFLVADFAGFQRKAHFRYIPLAGGDAAVRQPWRSALSYLRDSLSLPNHATGLRLWKDVPEKQISLVSRMLQQNINCVPTSSCGRLFDAIASLIGLRHEVNFEGQAAIELQAIAGQGVDDGYIFEIEEGEPAQIDFRPMVREIVSEVEQNAAKEIIAAKFHNTLANVSLEICRRIRESDGLNRVCLSGGTFQNFFLVDKFVNRLEDAGFQVYLHAQVPPNDGGISLGQAVIANAFFQQGA